MTSQRHTEYTMVNDPDELRKDVRAAIELRNEITSAITIFNSQLRVLPGFFDSTKKLHIKGEGVLQACQSIIPAIMKVQELLEHKKHLGKKLPTTVREEWNKETDGVAEQVDLYYSKCNNIIQKQIPPAPAVEPVVIAKASDAEPAQAPAVFLPVCITQGADDLVYVKTCSPSHDELS